MSKKVVSLLPKFVQQELKRWYYWAQIRLQQFTSEEIDYIFLEKYVASGDWVIDVGANIGHYTTKLSELVGVNGRVIAFEPVPETFSLLTSNTSHLTYQNVTLINAAVSDRSASFGMEIPKFESGLNNYYEAHLSDQESSLNILGFSIDSLCIPHQISLIKIDAENHEPSVLLGLRDLLNRDHPTLIVEGNSLAIEKFLFEYGYSRKRLAGSPNTIFINSHNN